MFILQTIQEFIDNPMGKGSTAIPSRKIIREDLNRRYKELIKHKDKVIKPTVYKDGDEYIFHFLIPSEDPERKNTYDVVLHFTTEETDEDKKVTNDKNLKRYNVKFFSNSPSFTYTFAYAFQLYGILIGSLKDKYRKIVLDRPPVTRNPGEIVNYDKTIYFAAHFFQENEDYLDKETLNKIAKPFKLRDLVSDIRNTDKIELQIKQALTDKESKKKEKTSSNMKRNKVQTTRKDSESSNRVVTAKRSNNTGNRRIKPQSKTKARTSSINKIKPR